MEHIETAASPADDGVVTLDELSSQPAPEEATSPAEASEDTLDDLTKEALGETEASPEDEIEIEYDGDKRKLPPKWKDAFLRHQDYTHKTMDLAEKRKAFEEEQTTFKANVAQITENFQAHAQLGGLKMRIQELERVDTTGWSQEAIQSGVNQLNALRQQAMGLEQTIVQRKQAMQASAREAREKCLAEAAAKVPNFDARRQELEELALSVGADKDDVAELSEPWAYELLHYADIGKKFIERQRRASQMRTAHAGQPATTLGGASVGGKSPEDMSMDEYVAWRQAGNG